MQRHRQTPQRDHDRMMTNYASFLANKSMQVPASGLTQIPELPGCLKPFQAAITSWALRRGRAAMFEGTGLGKAQPALSCVLTPSGWKYLRDIAVGDYVIGSRGEAITVTGVFPQGKREAYRVAFSDGVSVLCDCDHLWAVQNKKQRHMMQGWRVRSVSQLVDRGLRHQQGWRNFIPLVQPITFPEADLPLDPYLLGCLIGDGSFVHGTPFLSSADEDILLEVARLLPAGISLKFCGGYDWRISGDSKNNQWSPNAVTSALRALGLHGKKSQNKFIPSIYAFASVPQRCAMLQGLLDTDGHIRPADNNIEFCTSSEELAKDVRFLVQSLGGIAHIRFGETTHLPRYRMSVQPPPGLRPFRLPRKANVYHDREKYQPSRAIVSIEATGEIADMICISVAAEDQLYVTEHCIVTHNTLQQLAWAQAVANEEDARILVLTPLAVAEQTVAEAAKFGIPSTAYASDQRHAETDIVVTNYERFEKFDISQFVGIVLDESGIIKSQDGATRQMLTEACRETPWKLCCSATPAPNDYTELGQHAEFLGVMTAKEMLSMFFVHDGSIRANDHSQTADGWRLKRHAVKDFWRWLASWSVMVRHPSDLGFDEPGYDLPPLNLHQITVAAEYKPTAGMLFPIAASTLGERIGVRKDTAVARVAAAVEIVLRESAEPWLIWCNLNSEADAIERMLPAALQVAGRDPTEQKITRLLGFKDGHPLHLVSKASIAGHGMNYQHCARMIMVGLTDSFEQVYQAIRRCWRFGQLRPVDVYFVASELEGAVVANLRRKEDAFDKMLDAMGSHMRDLMRENVIGGRNASAAYNPMIPMEIPVWL